MRIARSLLRRRRGSSLPRIWQIPERGLVYVHVPKVATRSVRSALALAVAGEPDADRGRSNVLVDQAIERYERFAHPREIARLDASSFVFGFVRDPLDRLLSAYQDKVVRLEGDNEMCRRHRLRADTPFDEFVRVVAETSDDDCDRHLCSQHRFLCHRGRPVAGFVGRFERLEDDWQRLRDRLDLPRLPHRNPSGEVRNAYSRSLVELVARRYRRDIEIFGYADAVRRASEEAAG